MVLQAYESLPYATAVWVWDNSATAYINNTVESQIPGGTAFSIFEDTADYLYIGLQSRFDLVAFLLAVAGTVGTVRVDFYDGAWTRTNPRTVFDFTYTAGAVPIENPVSWTTLAFAAGTPHAPAPPDTATRYWIRLSVSSTTTAPTVNQIIIRPFARYANPTDIFTALQMRADFSSSTTPTRNTVEDFIRKVQSNIDYVSRKSWRINWVQDEEYDFNHQGIRLLRRDLVAVGRMQMWNGAQYDTLTQGRQNDYFAVNELGMIYFPRYFIFPARLASSISVYQWGFGEFKTPVRVSYLWGRDLETDRQGFFVRDLAIKMAAVDIYLTHDYSIITNSGVDRVSLERKIENWKYHTEEALESLRSWEVI